MNLKHFRITFMVVLTILSAQGIFHVLGNAEALQTVNIAAFAEQRKSLDNIIARPLMIFYIVALILGLACVLIDLKNWRAKINLAISFTLICLLIDVLIAIKTDIPINKAFHNYPFGNFDWLDLRAQWAQSIVTRGWVIFTGYVCLVFAAFNLNSSK